MGKKKVKAYVKKKYTPENKIIEELQSKYNAVNIYNFNNCMCHTI